MQAIIYYRIFLFSKVSLLGFGPHVGLRLLAWRKFQAFFASSACQSSATSYYFAALRRFRGSTLYLGLRRRQLRALPFGLRV